MPIVGERKMATTVLVTPEAMTTSRPPLLMPAPSRPPIRAWLLDEGMPSHQVITFHAIAPIRAPKMMPGSTIIGSMIPFPTVSATWRPKNRKAMKLKKAAQATATGGLSTRVETTVAIELAASCRPFRKSKASATPMSATSSGKASVGSIVRAPLRRGR